MTDNTGYKAAELADQLREGEVDANLDAVLTDDAAIGDVLMTCERAGIDTEAPLYQFLSRQSATDALRDARQHDDIATMNAATGLSESRVEATGYDRLLNACAPAAQQVVIRGQKGTGKTGTALELIRWLYVEGEIEKVATNVPVKGMTAENIRKATTLPDRIKERWLDPDRNEHLGELGDDVRFVETISGFLEFAKEPGEKVGLFDEFSTVGNAYNNQGDVESILGRVINAFRKSPNGSMRTVYIGHENDNDIHPVVRKQSDVVVSKDGKADVGKADLATVFEHWNDYLKGNAWFKIRGINDVPENSPFRYSTNYFAHLEWDLDNPDKQISRGRLIDNWERYQEQDDDLDTSEVWVQCRGEKTNGDPCGATVQHESGYCHAHRAQWDGESDPRIMEDYQ